MKKKIKVHDAILSNLLPHLHKREWQDQVNDDTAILWEDSCTAHTDFPKFYSTYSPTARFTIWSKCVLSESRANITTLTHPMRSYVTKV